VLKIRLSLRRVFSGGTPSLRSFAHHSSGSSSSASTVADFESLSDFDIVGVWLDRSIENIQCGAGFVRLSQARLSSRTDNAVEEDECPGIFR
jgi:hypothetical protein